MPSPLRPFAVACLLAAVACGRSEQGAADSAGASAAAAAPADSAQGGMAGMQPGAANEPAPRDTNQAFLRMMVDHHNGLVAMSDTALPRLAGATAKADAQKLRDKQASEGQQMAQMLQSTYSDAHAPMILPSNQAMIDSVRATPAGAEADRAYYRQVVAHHREGVAMAQRMQPQLTGDVRAMAEKMVAEQQREIQEFERKAGGTR
jgi:uncharacterized protein (DUF305 family)